MEFIKADKACRYFGNGETLVKAVDSMSFSIQKGSFTVIVGPSGAGKTTLLNLLGGMDGLTSGQIQVGDFPLFGASKKELTLYRRQGVGFVFQFYNLMPNLTAKENVELATEICPQALDIDATLTEVGLKERKDYFPSQLSGGEQQRVSIARALAKNPEMLLCDEPTGALDYQTGKLILRLLYDTSKKNGKTVVIVTHNSALTRMADQVISIRNGGVKENRLNPNPEPIEDIEW